MKKFTIQNLFLRVFVIGIISLQCELLPAQLTKNWLVFHEVQTDNDGKILPWYSNNLGQSYDKVIDLCWYFWDNIRTDYNGLPYYMNHAMWLKENNDPIAIGGDQIQMALSSWQLYYAYTGNKRVYENMKFMTDYYLTHSLSKPGCFWPDIPYPCNTLSYSGIYDGDMIIGEYYTQPDKAGSFGWELINMHKLTTTESNSNKIYSVRYLDAAIKIANTLAKQVKPGDENNSPLPFKVNTETNETGQLLDKNGKAYTKASYTTNWSATLNLFNELIKMNKGNTDMYKKAFKMITEWMVKYPLKNNKWGPFFEDVPGWSDCQINATTFAWYIMENKSSFPNWQKDVEGIFNWVNNTLGNQKYANYGVVVIAEQTASTNEGNSHTSRQASAELLYCKLTGDNMRKENAIRQLNWATYMVNEEGVNQYPIATIWMTDGYGDYVRHYLRSMAAFPELAPDNENHIVSSTSVVNLVEYAPDDNEINYTTYDLSSTETLRMTFKPSRIWMSGQSLLETETLDSMEGWTWKPLEKGGILTIRHDKGNNIAISNK
jgi:hypothetical protein